MLSRLRSGWILSPIFSGFLLHEIRTITERTVITFKRFARWVIKLFNGLGFGDNNSLFADDLVVKIVVGVNIGVFSLVLEYWFLEG